MYNILDDAFEKRYAVPQFNMNGLIWLESILKTAEKCKAPVIVGTTDKIVDKLGGFELLVSVFKIMKKDLGITVPAVLHLDHGQTVERCKEAIDAGYDSVMYDGSKLPIEENVKNTREVVEYAHHHGVTVEAEVGSVGGTEDGIYSDLAYADQNECIQLVKETGVDSLAPALGSVHGKYKGEPNLGFDEMASLREATDVPFVLHGASGISDADLQKAISYGHAKINYNTELNIAWSDAVRKVLTENQELYAPMEIFEPSKKALDEVIETVIKRTNAYQKSAEQVTSK
ncbi:class II fructose-bisphosphate aldolase [Fictibacillus phosphorivorans]|uniref:class II fructose-bisphosphate aldolase n=1 Tax=Fictibacillus phosphorivorans TaxID=1221500 RepID=UPI00203B2C92|nr:ketose-bisphosphate aldolase [Fictibacillus phosphorivorans]MCM3717708.1 ketose-bisphosphate aldolase [Fictibacillus phosphorivorans]MCM3775608.1 ketose-bisphosphate aldolase [Fictibacillus phosphorivorans]